MLSAAPHTGPAAARACRLTFRQPLVEDGREQALYDWESRVLTVHLPKAEPGRHFEGLQMLAELLAPPSNARLPPKIEVLSSTPAHPPGDVEAGGVLAAEQGAGGGEGGGDGSEWEAVQSVEAAAGLEPLLGSRCGYGFNRAFSGVFLHVPPSEAGMQCPSPDLPGAAGEAERAELRLQHESAAYDDDHYAADLLDEDDEIAGLLAFRPWWLRARERLICAGATRAEAGTCAGDEGRRAEEGGAAVQLGAEEAEQLRALRLRSHLLSAAEAAGPVPSGLVDLLFAYCHEWRCTLGEGSCESAWTVLNLSATLSWLARFEGPPAHEVCLSCVRRSLVFPLHRHWQLALTVLDDVAAVLELGSAAVLRCLLRVRALLEGADGEAHLLNEVVLDGYIGWLQHGLGTASAHGLRDLAAKVRSAGIDPSELPPHFCALASLDDSGRPGSDAGASRSGTNSEADSDDGVPNDDGELPQKAAGITEMEATPAGQALAGGGGVVGGTVATGSARGPEAEPEAEAVLADSMARCEVVGSNDKLTTIC